MNHSHIDDLLMCNCTTLAPEVRFGLEEDKSAEARHTLNEESDDENLAGFVSATLADPEPVSPPVSRCLPAYVKTTKMLKKVRSPYPS